MQSQAPFQVQGVKIPMLANEAMFADLTGGVLNTALYIPWSEVVESIRLDGVNTVTLMMSAGVLRNYTDNAFDPGLNYNPSMQATRALVSLLQENGLNVVITTFAHVANVISGDGSLGQGDRPRPTDPVLWQQNFGASILEWASFAQEVGATAFIPFTDETQHLFTEASLTDGWLDLIAEIRTVFSGHLSTGWYTDGSGTNLAIIPGAIIDQLDSVGIGFFPHLTNDPNASLEALEAAYLSDRDGNNLVQLLEGFASTYGKQVWITDKAFHSFDGAAADEARIFDLSIPLTQDLQEQALLYDSFLQVLSENNSGWLAGVSFQNFNNMRDDGPSLVPRFMNGPLSESPQDKPAESVMASWFLGHRQGEGLTATGGTRDDAVSGGYHADVLTGGAGADTMIGLQGNDVFHADGGDGSATGYVIDIALRGVPTGGVAPIVTARDAGGAPIATATVTAALDPSAGAQQGEPFHLVFEVESRSGFSLQMDNWTFVDFSSTGNRFVRIEGLTINGNAVVLGASNLNYEWSNGEQAGARDSVHGGTFGFDLASTVVAPVPLSVSPDNDSLDGGTGLDSAVYAGETLDYAVSSDGSGFRIVGLDGQGSDTLLDVERVLFADGALALDLDGNAGMVVKVLGAALGMPYALNPFYLGLGIRAVDATPLTIDQLAAGVMSLVLPGASNAAVVDRVYQNLAGYAPSPADAAFLTGLIDSGQITVGQFVAAAADLEINALRIGLAGLYDTGLAFV